jgi:NapC/NirT cytochrome c family, N-terminal region
VPEESTSSPKAHWTRLRLLMRNPVSLAGVALALVSLGNIFLFSLIAFIAERPGPYVGILAYMVSPGFLICGLLLMFVGAWGERRRRAREGAGEVSLYPRIDLNDPGQRSAVLSFATFMVVFVMLSGVGSYKAYEFTDSVQFCGQTCHTVMHPEFTAYQFSPHARVTCVECHVGSGATWYVKSKLSGTRQVFAAAFNTFPRPIPTPVHNLRPAQETCEQCHWPRKFYGAQLKVFTRYSSDENNSLRRIRMLINTGGGDPMTGAPQGIHWHMNIANEISYVAADDKRQVIPYMYVKDVQGRVTEYFAKDSPLSKDQIAHSPKHRMDCVDCHNRPTHVYLPPDDAIDQSLLAGRIDVSLSYIKQQAVSALSGKYDSTDAALRSIAKDVGDFYRTKYPELARRKSTEIKRAISEIQQIYQRTTFPEMRLNWQTHADNLGHFYFNGCFRCHDGQHISPDGKVIKKECDLCHTILAQEQSGVSTGSEANVNFQHPVDLGDMKQVNCSDCHTGGAGP